MSLVRMRTDIEPICDEHLKSMELVLLVWQVGTDAWTRHVFACKTLRCLRHYDIIHGYYTISDGRTEVNTKTHVSCPIDGLPMYLNEYRPQRRVGMWMCAQFGCEGKETRASVK